jgi:hypothetical protein
MAQLIPASCHILSSWRGSSQFLNGTWLRKVPLGSFVLNHFYSWAHTYRFETVISKNTSTIFNCPAWAIQRYYYCQYPLPILPPPPFQSVSVIRLRVPFLVGARISLFAATSRPALDTPSHALHPMGKISGDLSPGVKRPGHEADHSSPPSAEVNNVWS